MLERERPQWQGRQLSEREELSASGLDEVTSRLTDGLKACRTIVSDYRQMIAGKDDSGPAQPEEPEEPAHRIDVR